MTTGVTVGLSTFVALKPAEGVHNMEDSVVLEPVTTAITCWLAPAAIVNGPPASTARFLSIFIVVEAESLQVP